ncbi:MAG TPA: hypothetical protein PKY30_25805, partial [Myxococcota bacterium]|nr:hypothetical protein [Myxococcota bacterium]
MTLLLFLACTPDPKDSSSPDSPGDSGEVPTYAGSATWCDRVAPAAPLSENTILSLSAAHATIRLFGPDADMLT